MYGYKFRFVHQNVTGFVHVFPAGAIVRWAGMDFQSDAVRGELAAESQTGKIILPARKRLARARVASRAEQHARYIDCGPGARDDR